MQWGLYDDTEVIGNVPKHWEIHTDLVLFPTNAFKNVLAHHNQPLEIMEQRRNGLWGAICDVLSVKRIAIKNSGGIRNDDFRSPSVTLIYGFKMRSNKNMENGNAQEILDTWAQRIENGIIQTWDITQCMFSVGNVSEKLRVAKLNCSHETVVDLFAGIGYFVLPYLIHAKANHVFACEWNPASVKALKQNLQLNNIPESRYTIIQGDNRLHCPKNVADRVNLGLIPSSESSYEAAINALKEKTGGTLHIHSNVRRTKAINTKCDNIEESKSDKTISVIEKEKGGIILKIDSSVSECKYIEWKCWALETARKIGSLLKEKNDRNCIWTLSLLHLEHVKAFAPFVDHLVLDLCCTPTFKGS